MTMSPFNLNVIHPSWRPCLQEALTTLNPAYVKELANSSEWLPGPEKIFNAFSLPMDHVKYVLFGESPYPRRASANGYAFWDAAVQDLWSPTGLSKPVNRATSLRNFIKMLLTAEGLLKKDHTQESIAELDKSHLVQTNQEFFSGLLKKGFLLLNATPVLQPGKPPQKDARQFQPFIQHILNCLISKHSNVQLILFGNIAKEINKMTTNFTKITKMQSEHPYNHSFIHNKEIQDFFRPLHLLRKS